MNTKLKGKFQRTVLTKYHGGQKEGKVLFCWENEEVPGFTFPLGS